MKIDKCGEGGAEASICHSLGPQSADAPMSRSSSCVMYGSWGGWVPWIPPSGWCGPDLVLHSQEKRRKQAEIESRRRQLEDDRRQLQHLKVGLGEGRGYWQV